MNINNPFKIMVVVGAVALLLWGAYVFAGMLGFLLAVAATLIWIIIEFYRRSYVSITEVEVGVIFNRKGNFVCFLDNDYGRIEPHKRPCKRAKPLTRHSINPITEQMTGIITKGSQKAEGTLDKFRTVEGVPIKLKWSVSFKIAVTNIKKGLEYKMARGLPQNAPKMVGNKAELALRHIVEKKRLQDLYTFDGEYGSLQQLEIELRDQVRELTALMGTNIGERDVKLGPIEFPEEFEEALQNRFKKELQTETLVDALDRLRRAIHQYDESDIERLTELERLRILDEKSESLLMIPESFMSASKLKDLQNIKNNGSARSGAAEVTTTETGD